MKKVRLKDLKVGQVILSGSLDDDEFEVGEVREIAVHFKNWEKFNIKKGALLKKGEGLINLQEANDDAIYVLSSIDLIKVNKMKNKILMLEELGK